MAKIIRQVVTFEASPHEVYEALMDSKKHSAFTGDQASISRQVGGSIQAGDGYISGTNLELIPDQKIVQAWRGSDFPEGVMSKATFSLKDVDGGTRLTFTHSGVPDELFDSIKNGWVEFYWQPLAAWLAKQTKK
ncbi:MAG: SRPBCC family protein [Chloroflexota bacterium]|nr:SRPBCC family protein [Chloroflexota bacterium]